MLKKLLDFIFPHVTIYDNGKSYLTRYFLLWKERKYFNLFLHHFHASDSLDELHNHPWDFGVSFILSGGYLEKTCELSDADFKHEDGRFKILRLLKHSKWKYKPSFSINVIKRNIFHRVRLLDEERGTWTIFFTTRRSKDWFFVDELTGEVKDWRNKSGAVE